MKRCDEKSSGPWPCYEITLDELTAVCGAVGIAVEHDGQPAAQPSVETIDQMILTMEGP